MEEKKNFFSAPSRLRGALLLFSLAAAAAEARPAKKASRDPRTVGLGRNCLKTADCKHRSQKCLKEIDANGKPVAQGFCVLPCASFEAGTTKVVPGAPVDVSKKAKKPPPRCPQTYQCRSAGSGVPIDMCVKE
jgi:hypothetical protein